MPTGRKRFPKAIKNTCWYSGMFKEGNTWENEFGVIHINQKQISLFDS